MRDIKFRAYETPSFKHKLGIMLVNVGFHPSLIWALHMDPDAGYDEGVEDYIVSPAFKNYNLMQYTGQKDKNGIEIYEGDIYHQGDTNIKYIVIFEDCQFVGRQIGNKSLAGLFYFKDKIEIIGNIHENKDLMGGK